MKDLWELSDFLDNIESKITEELVKVQRQSAEEICNNAKEFAPGNEYKESIRVKDTVIEGKHISTEIVTNATVTAKSTGNTYNLGYLLENGTLEHAIPNAFGMGNFYGYIDRFGYRHKGTLDKDWHPGFRPLPHFIPALLLNKEKYNQRIQKVLDKEFK